MLEFRWRVQMADRFGAFDAFGDGHDMAAFLCKGDAYHYADMERRSQLRTMRVLDMLNGRRVEFLLEPLPTAGAQCWTTEEILAREA